MIVGKTRRYRLQLTLCVGTLIYVGLATWLAFEGARHGGSNAQTAFLIASLAAVWPVAWGVGVWSAVTRAGFSRRAQALTALAISQMVIGVSITYFQTAAGTSYFEALALPLFALAMGILWYALLAIARIERSAK